MSDSSTGSAETRRSDRNDASERRAAAPHWLSLVRRRPDFRRLWLAALVSQIGDWLSFVAVSVLTMQSGTGALGLAAVLVVHQLPVALLSPIAGTIVDRVDRRRVLLWANVLQALLTVLAGLAAGASVAPLVLALVLARTAVAAFLLPADAAALRRVVDQDELLAANALLAATWSTCFVIGMAAGGALALLGAAPALYLDALTFVLAAALLYRLPAMRAERDDVHERVSFVRELRDAWRVARERAGLVPAVLGKTPVALAAGGAWLVLNLVAEDGEPLGTTALSLGVMQALRGLGTGIGPALAMRSVRAGRSSELAQYRAWTAIAMGSMLAFAVASALSLGAPILLVAVLVWGAGSGANWVLASSVTQRLAGDSRIGRLSSIDELATTLSMMSGATIAALVVDAGGAALTAVSITLALGALAWAAIEAVRARGAVPVSVALETR